MTMTTEEALNILRQVKNRYQAFEKLEEVINEVTTASSRLTKLNNDIAKAEDSLAKTKAKVDKAESQVGGQIKKLQDRVPPIKTRTDKRISDLRSEVEGWVAKKDAAEKDYKTLFEDLDASYKRNKAAKEADLKDLDDRTAKAQRALDRLRKQVAA